MNTIKNLGIWLDHSNAHLMEYTSWPIETKNIEVDFRYRSNVVASDSTEAEIIIRPSLDHSAYYRKLEQVIKKYKDILLFGPTDEKNILSDLLKTCRHFTGKKIAIRQTDKMTENQQHAFVREYFSTR